MTGVKLVNDATALLSMRESDFDTYSAYGEAVDNSIQANAKNISLKFETARGSRNYETIKQVAFIDDGHGMDSEIIHRCLQLGYSSRFNDRSGIGRFGVGMTLGAIHECSKVEVYSKIEGSDTWLYTCIDLGLLTVGAESSDIGIPSPKSKNLPGWLGEHEGQNSGTVVIWSDYDRQTDTAPIVIEQTKTWVGRTFRKFIWDGVSISVNGEKIFAIDPLYVETKLTKFPSDPKASEVEAIKIEWPVPEDVRQFEGQKSTITIRLSLLPEELRLTQGSGNSNAAKERHITENIGISITRMGREVFYGPVPYWPGDSKWFSEIDRWWGCEIEFEPLLDRSFTVKNIKRGAVPNKELKKTIFELIDPTVRGFLVKIREKWSEEKARQERERAEKEEHKTGHEGAEETAKKASTDSTSKPVNDPVEAEQELLERLKRERTAEEAEAVVAKWRDQPFTIEEDQWRGHDFMELKPLGGNDVLLYNNNHPFMSSLTEKITILSEQDDSQSKELAKQLKCLIDLLLISYSKAESKFSDSENEDMLELLRINWGQYLKSYVKSIDKG